MSLRNVRLKTKGLSKLYSLENLSFLSELSAPAIVLILRFPWAEVVLIDQFNLETVERIKRLSLSDVHPKLLIVNIVATREGQPNKKQTHIHKKQNTSWLENKNEEFEDSEIALPIRTLVSL